MVGYELLFFNFIEIFIIWIRSCWCYFLNMHGDQFVLFIGAVQCLVFQYAMLMQALIKPPIPHVLAPALRPSRFRWWMYSVMRCNGLRAWDCNFTLLLPRKWLNKTFSFCTLWVTRSPYKMTKIVFRGLSHRYRKNE
jgi:hypothetical protein